MRGAVDHQTFDLMEHRRVGGVTVDAVGAAGHDDAQRPAVGQSLLHVLAQHGARLHRRGVGAQHDGRAVGARGQIEGVLHLSRRMIGRNVECGEIVPVVLDVGTVGPGESHLAEDRRDLVHHLADRVKRTLPLGSCRQADVDLLGDKLCRQRRRGERALADFECRFDLALELVHLRAEFAALFGRHRAQCLHQAGDAALLAEDGHARNLERRQIGGGRHGVQRLAAYGRKITHPSLTPNRTRKREPAVQAPSLLSSSVAPSYGAANLLEGGPTLEPLVPGRPRP